MHLGRTDDGYELHFQVRKILAVPLLVAVPLLASNNMPRFPPHAHTHTIQVNHLSHFLLTLELLPSLLETAGSTGDGRIVFVSSSAHRHGSVDPDNMNGEQWYRRSQFYGNSKLYNVSKWHRSGKVVISCACMNAASYLSL